MSKDPTVMIQVLKDTAQIESKTILLDKYLTIREISLRNNQNIQTLQDPEGYNSQQEESERQILVGRERQHQRRASWIKLSDISVSRNHCSIQYQPHQMRADSVEYNAFISCCSEGLPSKGAKRITLPKRIGMKVMEYLYRHERYVIRDCGSKFGTKIKILKPMKIEEGGMYDLGDEIKLEVMKIVQVGKEPKKDLEWNMTQSTKNQVTENGPKISTLSFSLTVGSESPVFHSLHSRLQAYPIGMNQEIPILGTAHLDYFNPQSIIFYKKHEWWIMDGDGLTHSSLLGTYRRIKPYEHYTLDSAEQIHVGQQTVLKFHLIKQ